MLGVVLARRRAGERVPRLSNEPRRGGTVVGIRRLARRGGDLSAICGFARCSGASAASSVEQAQLSSSGSTRLALEQRVDRASRAGAAIVACRRRSAAIRRRPTRGTPHRETAAACPRACVHGRARRRRSTAYRSRRADRDPGAAPPPLRRSTADTAEVVIAVHDGAQQIGVLNDQIARRARCARPRAPSVRARSGRDR